MISEKQALRTKMRRLRDRLTPAERRNAAEAVARTLQDFLDHRFAGGSRLRIAVYAAIQSELSLSAAWPVLQQRSTELFFPAVCGTRLCFGQLPDGVQPDLFLHPGVFRVPEPPPQSLLTHPPHLDLVLVPGLVFDRQGGRIGWGKAYYDRFLAELPRSVVRVGVCYSCQVIDAVPADTHDARMDYLLTPEAWQACRQGSDQ